jgi:ribosomal protein S18 acetylase RimI-like enzyme
MTVREAELSDAHGIARIHVTCWQTAYRGILPDSTLDNLSAGRVEEAWKGRLAEGEDQVLVYDREGQILGFTSFGASRDEDKDASIVGEMYQLYLDPDEWRKGYGSRLTRAVLKALRSECFSEVTLWVLRENERGRGFYEAMGFEPDGAEKVETRRDGTEMNEVRYRLRLVE